VKSIKLIPLFLISVSFLVSLAGGNPSVPNAKATIPGNTIAIEELSGASLYTTVNFIKNIATIKEMAKEQQKAKSYDTAFLEQAAFLERLETLNFYFEEAVGVGDCIFGEGDPFGDTKSIHIAPLNENTDPNGYNTDKRYTTFLGFALLNSFTASSWFSKRPMQFNFDMVDFLLSHGADPNMPFYGYMSALDVQYPSEILEHMLSDKVIAILEKNGTSYAPKSLSHALYKLLESTDGKPMSSRESDLVKKLESLGADAAMEFSADTMIPFSFNSPIKTATYSIVKDFPDFKEGI
jgi:hypothetical protein